jgi:hypothetical protein
VRAIACATLANSRMKRLLPTPGSPEKKTMRGRAPWKPVPLRKSLRLDNDVIGHEGFPGHEKTERIVGIVSERAAWPEPETGIEASRRRKGFSRAGFQAQPRIRAPPGLVENVAHEGRGHPFAQMRRHRAHRLDFAMSKIQLLDRPATQQLGVLPCAPEGDLRLRRPSRIERMNAFRRRGGRHVP